MRKAKIATVLLATSLLGALAFASSARAAEEPCDLVPKTLCFGVASLDAELSSTQAGAHPDLTFTFEIAQDPDTDPTAIGLRDAYSPARNVRIELPPGLLGDPNLLGASQQCTAAELGGFSCPNGSQIGLAEIAGYGFESELHEPIYMMRPPGGEAVARVGLIAAVAPLHIDFSVRSEGDYGLTAELRDSPSIVNLVRAKTTIWGVPADPVHDTERCTPGEVFAVGCKVSPRRPPGQSPTPFLTNATRCGVPLEMRVSASSWSHPEDFDTATTSFPPFTECNRLPFGPNLVVEPTNRIAGAPTGLDMTFRLPAPAGVNVLESSHVKDLRIDLPEGMTINPGAADGLETCNADQVNFGERVAAQCPDAAKFGVAEFDIPALPRKMVGSIYIREPIPGNLFRVWLVADDQGAHVKLPAELEVDEQTGQISSVVMDIPQVPVREVKLVMKSGFRAPVLNPPSCGTYEAGFEFVPWSGNPPVTGKSPFVINQGCDVGGFDPKLTAGTLDPSAGEHSPFVFTLNLKDGEQNPERLQISPPQGLVASLAGIPLCRGAAAQTGQCPQASKIGSVRVASGAGRAPLWLPQPGKRPTAVYLGGPYKGASHSVIAVVPAQAGPFDLGDQVVRSAIHVNPRTAEISVLSDPLPQILEGIVVRYRTLHVNLDKEKFMLNPSGCTEREIATKVTSAKGAIATPTAGFQASGCRRLGFKPRLHLRLFGKRFGRSSNPRLRAVLAPRPGDSNIARSSVKMPASLFLDQDHIVTICTRAQFATDTCPQGSIYGRGIATTPLLDEPVSGPVILRSSNNPLPDLVVDLRGQVRVEVTGKTDSVRGALRNTFEMVPDAPVTKFVLHLAGGRKGLLVASRNLCASAQRARVLFNAHNGRRSLTRPKIRIPCGKRKKAGRRGARRASISRARSVR